MPFRNFRNKIILNPVKFEFLNLVNFFPQASAFDYLLLKHNGKQNAPSTLGNTDSSAPPCVNKTAQQKGVTAGVVTDYVTNAFVTIVVIAGD